MFKTEVRAHKDGINIIVPIDEVEEFYNIIEDLEFYNIIEDLPTRYPRELKGKLKAYI